MRAIKARIWGVATASGLVLLSSGAWACGGLFCSAANPVEQTAERIVFARNADETITTIIEVQYQGPSEQFAWLLPMPGVPLVEVSTVEALDAIDRATAPRYQLATTYGSGCVFQDFPEGSALISDSSATSDPSDNGIDVLDQGSAGPYDYLIISADPNLDSPAQAAIDWLVDNDYDVGDTGPEVLDPYLAEGLNLVAFKLTKGNDVGAIRPVKLTYDGATPSIPIRPTAVAAQEDMGVRVFLLDEARAISNNYLSLELNEARINWFNWQSTYNDVVIAAANEAGGHGFVTEYAGSTAPLAETVWTANMQDRWVQLSDFDGTGAELMMDARNPFRSYAGFRRAVEAAVTLPSGVTLDEFAADPVGIEAESGGDVVDKSLFLEQLEIEVVDALSSAQALIDDHPYLSRLYTTLSPVEMTEDPSFVVNVDLPDVSNVHTAQMSVECGQDMGVYDAPWTITLEDGTVLSGEGQGSWLEEAESLPAALRITTFSAAGGGEVQTDNTDAIFALLAPPPAADDDTADDDSADDDSADDDSADDDTADDDTADDDTADDDTADDDTADDDTADDTADDDAADDDAAAEIASGDDDMASGASDDDGADGESSASSNKKDDDSCSVTTPGADSQSSTGLLMLLGLAGALLRRRRRG